MSIPSRSRYSPGNAGRRTIPRTIGVAAPTPLSRDLGKELVGQIAGRRVHFELRLARHDINARLKGAVGAVVGDLDREIKRDAERDRRDIQGREEWMPRQITQHMPAKETEILCAQV